jgi:hypothetical protein
MHQNQGLMYAKVIEFIKAGSLIDDIIALHTHIHSSHLMLHALVHSQHPPLYSNYAQSSANRQR